MIIMLGMAAWCSVWALRLVICQAAKRWLELKD